MANDRLRAAITDAGQDIDELADRAQVDTKTVGRWLSGRTPHPRHRATVAQLLDRSEHQLWPETAIPPGRDDARREILGAYAHSNHLAAPDWRTLLRQATHTIELLGYSLAHVLTTAGATDTLAAKAHAGCQTRVLIAGSDSIWVAGAAQQLGQAQEDYVGHSVLHRELELVRGHLEPLIDQPRFALRRFYADRFKLTPSCALTITCS